MALKLYIRHTLTVLLFFSDIAYSKTCARTQGTVGEISNLGQCEDKEIRIHPQTNDYFGGTDKLMTGSLHATYTDKKNETALRWRAITPTEECLNSPNWAGIWADWLSLERASISRQKNWIIGGSLSLSHFGHKGIKNFQRSLHKKLNCHYSWLTYHNQINSIKLGGTALAGYVLSENNTLYTEASIEYADDPALQEYGVSFLMNYQATKKFRISFETKARRILGSRLYTSSINTLKKFRYEATISLQLYSWRPSFKYLSPYLTRDIKRQINVDLFNTSF